MMSDAVKCKQRQVLIDHKEAAMSDLSADDAEFNAAVATLDAAMTACNIQRASGNLIKCKDNQPDLFIPSTSHGKGRSPPQDKRSTSRSLSRSPSRSPISRGRCRERPVQRHSKSNSRSPISRGRRGKRPLLRDESNSRSRRGGRPLQRHSKSNSRSPISRGRRGGCSSLGDAKYDSRDRRGEEKEIDPPALWGELSQVERNALRLLRRKNVSNNFLRKLNKIGQKKGRKERRQQRSAASDYSDEGKALSVNYITTENVNLNF